MLSLDETIEAVSERLLGLEQGPLAELRRMQPDGVGTPIFWHLSAEIGFSAGQCGAWMQLLRTLAILTPKACCLGPAVRLHDVSWQFGRALCDGGNPDWATEPQRPRPVLSEVRLACLLAMPSAQRGETIVRIARMLARSRDPESGIDCTEIARLLLQPNDPLPLRKVARDYYDLLDRAHRSVNQERNY